MRDELGLRGDRRTRKDRRLGGKVTGGGPVTLKELIPARRIGEEDRGGGGTRVADRQCRRLTHRWHGEGGGGA